MSQLNIFDTPAGPDAVMAWFSHQGAARQATIRELAEGCGMTAQEVGQIVGRMVQEGRLEEVQGPWTAASARYRVKQ